MSRAMADEPNNAGLMRAQATHEVSACRAVLLALFTACMVGR
jgi:hypothetical protein